MEKEKISVIVPIYNLEKYLPHTLERLVNQTYRNLEIILVDDGSKDNSPQICDEYAKKDERVKVIHQKNGGLSCARNAGIEVATGEYIAFFDPDDILSLDFYKYLYELITKTKSDISQCAFTLMVEDDALNGNYKFDTVNFDKYEISNKMETFHKLHNENKNILLNTVVVWNKLYKREVIGSIRFPEGKRYEDDFTTYKFYNNAKQIVSSNIALYGYVQRNNSIMHQEFSIKRLDALEAFDKYVEFFKEIPDEYLFAKLLVRYQRIIVTILKEVQESSYEDKQNVVGILERKFEEITLLLEDSMEKIDDENLKIIVENKKKYEEEFEQNKTV